MNTGKSLIGGLHKCASILHHKRAGNDTTEVGYLPVAGLDMISIVCPVVMGNATIVTLTLATADDASGTNTTALTTNVASWIYNSTYPNGNRQTDAKAASVPAANYTSSILNNFLVFEVPAIIVPSGKYLGIKCNSGSASNYYTAIVIEDRYYKS